MNEPRDNNPAVPPTDDHDAVLSAAGDRLRRSSRSISVTSVEAAVWKRRARGFGLVAAVSLAAVALLGGLLYAQRDSGSDAEVAGSGVGTPSPASVDRLLASLGDQPVDPTEVRLVSTVSTFPDCGALIGDLRRVGAQHVGSRGFGDSGIFQPIGYSESDSEGASDGATNVSAPVSGSPLAATGGDEGTTLGTNVQVEGVDELDFVKAVGRLVYDLDGRGNLRITDAESLAVLSTLDVTPGGSDEGDDRSVPSDPAQVSQLLVSDGQVVILGTEVEVSEPIEGDPSATRSHTSFMTVTLVDAADPATPSITDRVRIEGSLVSARLVDGEVRLVTTSNMADLGFLMPTTPNSVVKALDVNRRSVASSTAADWIPDWQRDGQDPTPLVPCERVHVPDTFAGVAMTSMVTFPFSAERFEPSGTSILAPANTLYAGLEKVAISSEVWVDPVDRDRLEFDDWQTAVHEFHFADEAAPTYVGSGIVDGSTIGQFAFGEIGESLAVVTTKGTPWQQDPDVGVDLTILTPDGGGALAETAKVADLSDGNGAVTAVRFVEGRVLISTGSFGRELYVIDVTDPARPRRAGSTEVPGTVGYFHPLPDHQALVIGSRGEDVGEGNERQWRSWVQAHLLDVSDADAPELVSTWERPWLADEVGSDHHAFTYWPDRQLAMWGTYDTQGVASNIDDRANSAAVISTADGASEVAMPVASKPDEVASPCPTVEVSDPDARRMVGPDGVVLRCDEGADRVEWPRYQCYALDPGTVARFAPGQEDGASFQLCSPAPWPTVRRVLVVAGAPMLLTDQTLERLDPQTFASTAIAYHPSSAVYGF